MSGKRHGSGSTSASPLSGLSVNGALPGTKLLVNGVNCDAFIDTGCTKCIVHAPLCSQWTRESVNVTTVSGERYQCMGTSQVRVQLRSGASATVSALVVPFKPLHYDFILGMNCVRALHGVTVRSSRDVYFGIEENKAFGAVETATIDDQNTNKIGNGVEDQDRRGFETLSLSIQCRLKPVKST